MEDEQVVTEVEEVETAETEEEIPAEETAESEEAEEETSEEPKKKQTAQERIQELANARREEKERADRLELDLKAVAEKAADLERKFTEKQAERPPEYIEITEAVLSQVNQRLGQLAEAKQNAELNGNYLQGIAAQKEIDAIYEGLKQNAAKMEQAQKMQAEQGKQQQIISAIDERAEFFRQQQNIPADVWKEGSDWFAQQCESNKILGAQFVEIAQYNGPMAAVKFAADYAAQHMPQKANEAAQAKETAKSKLPGGTGKPAPATGNDLSDDLPYDEWRKRREAQLKR